MNTPSSHHVPFIPLKPLLLLFLEMARFLSVDVMDGTFEFPRWGDFFNFSKCLALDPDEKIQTVHFYLSASVDPSPFFFLRTLHLFFFFLRVARLVCFPLFGCFPELLFF